MPDMPSQPARHSHVFLGEGHETSERKTWTVIWLCGAMMFAEIAGGLLFGSIALVADGMHMSTHAGALLLAALAYSYARKHANDPRFTFGTGKLGDLAGFTSAIILAMIAILIGYESISRVLAPVPIHFAEAIPIACLGLVVNIASAWLLSSGGNHHHDHSHGHGHGNTHGHDEEYGHDDTHPIATRGGSVLLEVFEDGVPPRFRLRAETGPVPVAQTSAVETMRPDGTRQRFAMADHGHYLESVEEIPEPHSFVAHVQLAGESYPVNFEEHEHTHGKADRDNNMRAAVIHVGVDAAVSVLVIAGLLLARAFGWLWMDPLAGIVGACVIASWSYGLIRDTGAILLDMNPDRRMAENVRQAIEGDGDTLADLHLWRLGPGHLGAIVSVGTHERRGIDYYRAKLARFRSLSHLTIEVQPLRERHEIADASRAGDREARSPVDRLRRRL
jgi:cation diffusion facilitator family transporter